eukprot:IDg5538t1
MDSAADCFEGAMLQPVPGAVATEEGDDRFEERVAVEEPAVSTIAPPAKRKVVRWSRAMDHGMLVIVNCLGPAKQVGHGNKTPFFTNVAEQAKSTS